MNRNTTIVAGFLAVSAAFFGLAHAQGPGCGMDGMAGMKRSAMQQGGMMDPAARIDQRLGRFKADLKLDAKQEPLWQAFAEKSASEATRGMQAMREGMQGDKPMSAPERMAQMQEMMKQRLAAMEGVNESFNRLYAALTPEQKAAADRHFGAMGHGRGPGAAGGVPKGSGPAAPTGHESHKS